MWEVDFKHKSRFTEQCIQTENYPIHLLYLYHCIDLSQWTNERMNAGARPRGGLWWTRPQHFCRRRS